MRRLSALLVTVFLLQACVFAQPVASDAPEPVPSAIQPTAGDRGDERYARRGLEALRAHLASQEDAAMAGELSLPDAGLVARCVPAEGSDPVILCQYGPTVDRWVAQALFWQADRYWLGQLYPQAPRGLAEERQQHFRSLGCNCQGTVHQIRLGRGEQGPELLVVVDLGTETAPMEEVHLLHLVGEVWSLAWAPAPGNWNWGHAQVTLRQPGLTSFRVRSSSWGRQDRFAGYLASPEDGEHRWFTERWVRKGAAFVLKDQAEEPGPYGALVRLIYYLSHHDERRAEALLGAEMGLEKAREALAQRPPRQGWEVVRSGPATFGLDRDGDGKPDLQAIFAEQGEGWTLNQLQ